MSGLAEVPQCGLREVSVDLVSTGDLNFGHLVKVVSARLLCLVVTVIPLY